MWSELVQTLIDAGPVIAAIAIIILVGAAFEIWVWGYIHRRELARVEKQCQRINEDRLFWRDKALTALGLGEEISEVATSLVEEKP